MLMQFNGQTTVVGVITALISLVYFITERISESRNAIASIRPSVHFHPFYLLHQLTFDLDLLHVTRS